MALIFSILLYILVAELVVASRMVRATGENDALLARMRTQMLFQLTEAELQLKSDLAGAAAGDGDAGGAGGLGAALTGAAGGGELGVSGAGELPGGEEEAADPTSSCDSSRDAWFEPTGFPDTDLTTYVWIEDENRKLNLLALWSPDKDFAEFSRDRIVRLIDGLREDTDFDVPQGDALRIVEEIQQWGLRSGTEQMPKARLKSDSDQRRDLGVPLHLDDLLLLPTVTEDLFFDKVLDGRYYPGLESVLTVWTSLQPDPGDPDKVARQRAQAASRGESPPGGSSGSPAGGAQGSGSGSSSGSGSGSGSDGRGGAGSGAGSDPEQPVQPEGQGIRINVNTASRAVLRALFPPEKVPDRILDAIIRHRNEVDEEATESAQEDEASSLSDFGNIQLGATQKRKFFPTTAELEEVEEFANWQDTEMKAAFQNALTTQSDVFSIHLATLFKRSEENRIYLLRRARSIVMRIDDGGEGQILPLVPFEDRSGLRLQPIDEQDERPMDLREIYAEMDQFAQEDRAWNPFLIDFYLPQDRRSEFLR